MDTTSITIALFDQYAEAYADKFNDVSLYHTALDFFCQQLPKENPMVLDVACGPGNISAYLIAHRPDMALTGIDLATGMLEIAKKRNPSAVFKCVDARNFMQLQEKYDGICCSFCLPYFNESETKHFFADAAQSLNKNGMLYLSTMEDKYENSSWKTGSTGDALFIHYYEMDWLVTQLAANGMELCFSERKINHIPSASNTIDLLMVARKSG